MMKKATKNITTIILLIILFAVICSCKKNISKNGWKKGRYDLVANINHAKLDKIYYDLGTTSTRKILQRGWGINKKSFDGRSFIKVQLKNAIIKLPPMSMTSRVLTFKAYPFLSQKVSSAFIALYINKHLIKRIKLLPGWKTYSIPIKGKYFSSKSNTLLFMHSYNYTRTKKYGTKEDNKPSVGYDEICFIRKELFNKAEKIRPNFIHLNNLKIAGDTRDILETEPNNHFTYQMYLPHPSELHFSLGLPKKKVSKIEQIEFQILANKEISHEILLFSKSYHDDIQQLCNGWNEFTVDLSKYKDNNLFLCFKTNIVPKENCKIDTISWGNPFLLTTQNKGIEKPNIIVYLVDALRADHLGCYGNPEVKTFFIDKFASEGVLFEKAFALASWTKPSIASLLTSTYPSHHGAIKRTDALTLPITTLAEVLRDNGYLTGAFHNQVNIAADFGFYQGFDSYVETYTPLKDRPLYAHHMNQLIFPWLKKNADTPFFLYIHTLDPHDPYNPPPPFDAMYEKDYDGSIDGSVETLDQILMGNIKVNQRDIQHLEALYNSEITINDIAFGEFIEKLKKLGLYDNSIIIFTSDHGEEFWEHKGVKHALTLYEEVIHVPFIMRLPSQLPSGRRINSMVSLIDMMPTILELLKFPIHPQCQGENLIPLIKDLDTSQRHEVYLEEDFGDKVMQSIRGRKWKLIWYPRADFIELFDLMKDPKETNNLAAQYPELTNSLMEKIKRWHQKQIKLRVGLHRPEAKKLSEETIKQLKALGYIK